MRKIIKNKYSLYKTINVSVQCSLKKRERERKRENAFLHKGYGNGEELASGFIQI